MDNNTTESSSAAWPPPPPRLRPRTAASATPSSMVHPDYNSFAAPSAARREASATAALSSSTRHPAASPRDATVSPTMVDHHHNQTGGTPSSSSDTDDDEHHRVIATDPTGRFQCWDISLGRGAFKEVFKAFDVEEGVEVAWNQLRTDYMSRKDIPKVAGEVTLLKQLRHDNIINFFHVWTARGNDGRERVYFITELMSSGTLKSFIRKTKGKLKPKVVKNLCRHILRGLEYLHSREPAIIHRDLKCDNIFINGNNGVAKIGDLGLATIKNKEHASSVLGTPEFMAPELYDERYDERVDIYAFGMCVLELVTKEYPYQECTNQAQIWKRVSAGIKPAALAKVADEATREFIELCIAHDYRARPSAIELLDHPFLAIATTDGTPLSMSTASSTGGVTGLGTETAPAPWDVAASTSTNGSESMFSFPSANATSEPMTIPTAPPSIADDPPPRRRTRSISRGTSPPPGAAVPLSLVVSAAAADEYAAAAAAFAAIAGSPPALPAGFLARRSSSGGSAGMAAAAAARLKIDASAQPVPWSPSLTPPPPSANVDSIERFGGLAHASSSRGVAAVGEDDESITGAGRSVDNTPVTATFQPPPLPSPPRVATDSGRIAVEDELSQESAAVQLPPPPLSPPHLHPYQHHKHHLSELTTTSAGSGSHPSTPVQLTTPCPATPEGSFVTCPASGNPSAAFHLTIQVAEVHVPEFTLTLQISMWTGDDPAEDADAAAEDEDRPAKRAIRFPFHLVNDTVAQIVDEMLSEGVVELTDEERDEVAHMMRAVVYGDEVSELVLGCADVMAQRYLPLIDGVSAASTDDNGLQISLGEGAGEDMDPHEFQAWLEVMQRERRLLMAAEQELMMEQYLSHSIQHSPSPPLVEAAPPVSPPPAVDARSPLESSMMQPLQMQQHQVQLQQQQEQQSARKRPVAQTPAPTRTIARPAPPGHDSDHDADDDDSDLDSGSGSGSGCSPTSASPSPLPPPARHLGYTPLPPGSREPSDSGAATRRGGHAPDVLSRPVPPFQQKQQHHRVPSDVLDSASAQELMALVNARSPADSLPTSPLDPLGPPVPWPSTSMQHVSSSPLVPRTQSAAAASTRVADFPLTSPVLRPSTAAATQAAAMDDAQFPPRVRSQSVTDVASPNGTNKPCPGEGAYVSQFRRGTLTSTSSANPSPAAALSPDQYPPPPPLGTVPPSSIPPLLARSLSVSSSGSSASTGMHGSAAQMAASAAAAAAATTSPMPQQATLLRTLSELQCQALSSFDADGRRPGGPLSPTPPALASQSMPPTPPPSMPAAPPQPKSVSDLMAPPQQAQMHFATAMGPVFSPVPVMLGGGPAARVLYGGGSSSTSLAGPVVPPPPSSSSARSG